MNQQCKISTFFFHNPVSKKRYRKIVHMLKDFRFIQFLWNEERNLQKFLMKYQYLNDLIHLSKNSTKLAQIQKNYWKSSGKFRKKSKDSASVGGSASEALGRIYFSIIIGFLTKSEQKTSWKFCITPLQPRHIIFLCFPVGHHEN